MRRVWVYFLGGTISMTRAAGRAEVAEQAAGPAVLRPSRSGPDLLAGLPTPTGVAVEPVDVAHVDSSALTVETCLEALRLADAAVRRGEADGVVVVQGTDTLEETAYLWDLLWSHPHPFVVTGAMRPPDMPGSDGPANLVAAVSVAASDAGRGEGVLVVVGDEVHAARHVSKRHTSSPSAFVSPDLGPVGWMHEGVLVVGARVPRRTALPVPTRPARVALVRATLDDDPALYAAAAELSEGLVVDGFGAGQVRPEVAEVLGEVLRTRPVVLTSRTGAGSVATRTYGGPGSGSDLAERGVLSGGRLGGLKARVLLRALLGAEAPPTPDALAAAFRLHGA